MKNTDVLMSRSYRGVLTHNTPLLLSVLATIITMVMLGRFQQWVPLCLEAVKLALFFVISRGISPVLQLGGKDDDWAARTLNSLASMAGALNFASELPLQWMIWSRWGG